MTRGRDRKKVSRLITIQPWSPQASSSVTECKHQTVVIQSIRGGIIRSAQRPCDRHAGHSRKAYQARGTGQRTSPRAPARSRRVGRRAGGSTRRRRNRHGCRARRSGVRRAERGFLLAIELPVPLAVPLPVLRQRIVLTVELVTVQGEVAVIQSRRAKVWRRGHRPRRTIVV